VYGHFLRPLSGQSGMRQELGLPVFYFTELMGVAFGAEKRDQWWKKHMISPKGLLESLDWDRGNSSFSIHPHPPSPSEGRRGGGGLIRG